MFSPSGTFLHFSDLWDPLALPDLVNRFWGGEETGILPLEELAETHPSPTVTFAVLLLSLSSPFVMLGVVLWIFSC